MNIIIYVNKTRVDPYFNSVEMKSDKSFRPIKFPGNKIRRQIVQKYMILMLVFIYGKDKHY